MSPPPLGTMASAMGTPPPSPRQLKGRPQQPSPPSSLASSSSSSPLPPPPRPRPVPIAHDITSLLLSLQGLFQRLSPYVSPALQSLAFVLTWQNKLLSAGVVASWCMLVLVGWDFTAFHLPFLAAIIGLGYAYAKRLGRGVSPPLVNPPPPSIPHLLHTLISATSSFHSAADRLDSLVTLVTFTRKSETASLALFRAVIVLYAIVAATVFCVGLRTVVLLAGVVALCWGSDFAQVAKAVAFIQIHDLCKQIGTEIQWVDDDDDEDLVVATSRDVSSAEQDKADAVRRGSESAARQLMGVPPKSSGMRKRVAAATTPNADGTAAPVKRLVKVVPKGTAGAIAAKKPQAAAAAAITIVPPVRKSSSDGGPAMLAMSQAAAATAIAAAAAAAPVTVSTDDLATNNGVAQTSSPTELASESAATQSDSSAKGEQEAPSTDATGAAAGTEAAGPISTSTQRRASATSSASSPEPQDRLKSRLEHVVRSTSRGTPSPTAVPESIPEAQDSAAVTDRASAVATAAVPSVPDESNVSVDKHPDWALPPGDGEDEITDDFHRALTGESSAAAVSSKLPLEQVNDDDHELDTLQAIETDYMNVELDQATDAFHQQMMREEEEEDANTLDENHFLRRRRSCDSDLTIDALANFSDPRRSSYTATTQNFIGLPGGSRKSRALSNTSQSTLSTLSSDTGSSTQESAAGMAITGRFRSVSDLDAKMGRFYSITDPIPQQRALSNLSTSSLTASSSASPSPLSPTPSVTGSSSRSSIRGANRRPLNVVLSFDTYENQRWWVGVGWVPHLLPTERGAWTDHAGRKDLPKSSFDLPEFRREQLEKINQDGSGGVDGNRPGSLPIPELPVDMASHRYAWDWDGPWHIDMLGSAASGSTDDDGWEYGDNFWSGWKKRKTLKRVVRRRRWVRLARLYEVGRKRSVTFGGSFVFDKETISGGGGDRGDHRAVFEAVTEEESQFRPSAAQLRQTFTPTWPEIDRDDMSSFNDEEYDLAQQQQARRESNPAEFDDFEDDGDGGGGGGSAHDEENVDDDDDGTRIEYPVDEEYNDVVGEDDFHHNNPQLHHRLPPPQQYDLFSHHDNDEHHHRPQPRRRDTGPPQFTSASSASAAAGSARQHRSYAEPRYYPEQ
ncbi:peroxisome- protein [Geranomyces variabilis]|uniref:Peroxisome- protein n=1 Tax=Geranomyces variabilis TaxID=109894 RepID=A0AAD5TTH7_9FUNG|nr:peroxisome- protein [Geranomyces variabilis]